MHFEKVFETCEKHVRSMMMATFYTAIGLCAAAFVVLQLPLASSAWLELMWVCIDTAAIALLVCVPIDVHSRLASPRYL